MAVLPVLPRCSVLVVSLYFTSFPNPHNTCCSNTCGIRCSSVFFVLLNVHTHLFCASSEQCLFLPILSLLLRITLFDPFDVTLCYRV